VVLSILTIIFNPLPQINYRRINSPVKLLPGNQQGPGLSFQQGNNTFFPVPGKYFRNRWVKLLQLSDILWTGSGKAEPVPATFS
jgi:hypothetical protein